MSFPRETTLRPVPARSLQEELDTAHAALKRGEWSNAKVLFTTALERHETPEALEGLGWALWWLDEIEPAFDVREHAYRLHLEHGDRRSAARVAIWMAIDTIDHRGEAIGRGWLERARRQIENADLCVEQGWLLWAEGHLVRMFDHDPGRARQLAGEAAEIARSFQNTELELMTIGLEGIAMVTEGNVVEGMRRLDEATTAAMAGEIEDLDAVAQTCCLLLFACERVHDYDRAAQWNERVDAFCRRWKIAPLFTVCQTQHAATLIGRGRLNEAETILSGALETIRRTRPLGLADAIVQQGELRRRQGRFEEAMSLFLEFEGRSESLLGRAAIAIDRGDPETAVALVSRCLRRPLAEKWIERANGLELLVHACLATGRQDEALHAIASLRTISDQIGTDPIRAIRLLAEGRFAISTGDHQSARRCLEDAIDAFDRYGAAWESARTRIELARLFASEGRTSLALDHAQIATSILEAMGAVGDARTAAALHTEIEKGTEPQKGTHRLTRRETEVLKSVAAGLGDKQIAFRLGLSEHTIHRHVANILEKTRTNSRAAAVAIALRDGSLQV